MHSCVSDTCMLWPARVSIPKSLSRLLRPITRPARGLRELPRRTPGSLARAAEFQHGLGAEKSRRAGPPAQTSVRLIDERAQGQRDDRELVEGDSRQPGRGGGVLSEAVEKHPGSLRESEKKEPHEVQRPGWCGPSDPAGAGVAGPVHQASRDGPFRLRGARQSLKYTDAVFTSILEHTCCLLLIDVS